MSVDVLPHRHADESAADFAARLSVILDVHLRNCSDCNYDRDCMACASGVSDLDATSHSCNCSDITPPGYGVQLRKLYKAALADARKER